MNPATEGLEEQGHSGVPFVNDPQKPANHGHTEVVEEEEDIDPVEPEEAD